jgi:hypothetical protein
VIRARGRIGNVLGAIEAEGAASHRTVRDSTS